MKSSFPRSLARLHAIGFCSLGMLLSPASAATTWTGGGGDNNWATATNWSEGIVPVVSSGDIVLVPGAFINVSSGVPLATGGPIYLVGGSTLNALAGADLTVNLVYSSPNSAFTLSGGQVNYRRLDGAGTGGTFTITGGSLESGDADSIGPVQETYISGGMWRFNLGTESYVQFGRHAPSQIHISGSGAMISRRHIVAGHAGGANNRADFYLSESGTLQAQVFEQRRGLVDVSGGTFNLASSGTVAESYDFIWAGGLSGTNKVFRITGNSGTINIAGNFVTNAGAGSGRREFVLSASNTGGLQANISTIQISGTDSAGGVIDAGLQGGILFAHETEYTLISSGTMTAAPTYEGSELYEAAVADNEYVITLDVEKNRGEVVLLSAFDPVSAAFSPESTGFLETDISAVRQSAIDNDWTLLVRLDVDPGSGTLDDVADALGLSAYSAVQVDPFGAYDISLQIDAEFLSANEMYFAWDLTDSVSGAAIAGLQLSVVPEPGIPSLVFAATAALALRGRRYQARPKTSGNANLST